LFGLTSSGVISGRLQYCNPVAVVAERFDPVVVVGGSVKEDKVQQVH